MDRFNKKTFRKIGAIIVLVTLLLGLLELKLLMDYKDKKESYNSESIHRYEKHYDTIIYCYRMLSRTYFDEVLNNKNVLNIMDKANEADEDKRKELRGELNSLLSSFYKNAAKNKFRQVQFVLKDCTSFLRMHRPELYGDNIKSIRDTVRIANEEKRYIEGFEEGRIYNGYRFEYPLFKGDKHIGCVEASISFASFVKLMHEQFDSSSMFIIKKSIVEEKVDEEFINIYYTPSDISDEYYIDNETIDIIGDNQEFKDVSKRLLEDKKALKAILVNMASGSSFIIDTKKDKQIYSVIFLSIKNVMGNHAGYLIFYNQNDVFKNYKRTIVVKSILVSILWILILGILHGVILFRIRTQRIMCMDKLTEVYNRNLLYEFLHEEIEKVKRRKSCFSIVMYDIDKFKDINDKYGHVVGDSVLKTTSSRVKDIIRKYDKVFRFGGDEFIVLLPNLELTNAMVIAEKIRADIASIKSIGDININITLSLGVVQFKDNETSESLIKRVDELLYKAKNTGRNKVVG